MEPSARVVLLTIGDVDLLAMSALMIELAGFQVLPVAGLAHLEARAHDMHPYAVVADMRHDADWDAVRRIQADREAGVVRCVVIIDGAEAAPPDVVDLSGARVLRWPVGAPDLLQTLLMP